MKIDPNDRIITLFDLGRIFLRYKKTFALVAGCSALWGLTIPLSRPVEYKIEASFKEQGEIKAEGVLKEFKEAFGSSFDSSQTPMVMKSQRVLKPLIERLGLQMKEQREDRDFFFLRHLRAELRRSLRDMDSFRFREVSYEKEKPLSLQIIFSDDLHFEVKSKKSRAWGTIGELVTLDGVSFRVIQTPKKIEVQHPYSFLVRPWIDLVKSLSSKLLITSHKQNRSLYALSLSDQDRFLGTEIVNGLMAQYQEYLKTEHDQRISSDLAYLQKREERLARQINGIFAEHKAYLKKNVDELGYMDLRQESADFSIPHRELFLRTCSLELEEKQLAAWQETDSPLLLEHTSIGSRIHSLSTAIQDLRRERSLLDDGLLAQLGEIEIPVFPDLEGMDLQTAKALLVESHRILDDSSLAKTQLLYLMERIEDPSFELSGLGALLRDEVSRGLLSSSLALHMQLQNVDHYTELERKRAAQALSLQRKIFREHLDRLLEAEERRTDLYHKQVATLQKICIGCIDQQISAHRSTISDLVHQRVESLKEEQALIKQKMQELREGMRNFPEHWHEERLLKLETEIRLKLLQAIQQLVETKTISQQFYHIASKPLNLAIPPLFAQKPRLVLFSAAAGLMGLVIAFVIACAISLLRGFPVGVETIKALGLPYFGRLGRSKEEELETLKKVFVLIQGSKKVALLFGSGPDYSASLMHMLVQSGRTVSVVRSNEVPFPSFEEADSSYQHLLFVSQAPLDSAEALFLAGKADHVIATLTGESLEQLAALARTPSLALLKS